MKKVVLFILLLTMLVLTGCTKTYLTNLKGEQLFSYEESSYLVYVYKDDCEECVEVTPNVEAYARVKASGEFEEKSSLYGFNLSNKTNSLIDRKYTEADSLGQGKEGNFFVDDVTNWEDLYIGNTPALIIIRTRNGKRIAEYASEGKDIVTYLQNYYELNN